MTIPAVLARARIGINISRSVIPDVRDQPAMAGVKCPPSALLPSLLPAIATVAGIVVARQTPTLSGLLGAGLTILAIGLQRDAEAA